MTSSATNDGCCRANLTTKEEEEELFEIDIDVVPSPCYCEINCSQAMVSSTAISSTAEVALFANCLLPTAHVSSAVPMPFSAASSSLACDSVISLEEQLLLCRLHRRKFQILAFQELTGLNDED